MTAATGRICVGCTLANQPVNELGSRYLQAAGHCVLTKTTPSEIVKTVCGCLRAEENHQLDWSTAAHAQASDFHFSPPQCQLAEIHDSRQRRRLAELHGLRSRCPVSSRPFINM